MSKENDIRRVIGLSSEVAKGVPRVVLKGAGRAAEDLIWQNQKGRGIPLVDDPELLDRLYRLPTDSPIPPELFELVAAVLVHVMSVDAAARESILPSGQSDTSGGETS